MCSVARGSTVGRRQPSASTSSWNCFSVFSVTSADRLVERQVRIFLRRARVDLVVDVGDVAHVGDVLGAVEVPQQPEQHVEHDHRPRVADMREVVDRRPAHIHAHARGIERRERPLLARERIVELQFHRTLPGPLAGRPYVSIRRKDGRSQRGSLANNLPANAADLVKADHGRTMVKARAQGQGRSWTFLECLWTR